MTQLTSAAYWITVTRSTATVSERKETILKNRIDGDNATVLVTEPYLTLITAVANNVSILALTDTISFVAQCGISC